MALKKSELYSSLWRSCDELRGGMDASQYKDYVLTLLFVKYVTDRYAGRAHALIEVPEGGSFADMVRLRGDKEIGDGMNKVIGRLAEANGLRGVIDLADFNDEDKLGKGKAMVDRLGNLVALFEGLDLSANRAGGDDLLGDAYEFLMRHFATESGKSKGQFYTPAEVSRIMARVVGVTAETAQDQTAYDPTCGSGSLLLKVADEAGPGGLTLYGQEKDNATAALAKMNMILHDAPTAEIWQDDTLTDPHWTEDGTRLKRFDFAVANPPFSTKSWTSGLDPANDVFGRFADGVPPQKNGDYAFLLHVLASLKSTGKGAVILPHGVLFRGHAEAHIRERLLRRGVIKGVIGLPANLFYGTGIPACIVVLDKEHAAERRGVFMVDASRGFAKDGPKNRLREQDVHRIVDTVTRLAEHAGYARMVPLAEIAANGYNLNLPRYIDGSEPEDLHDLDAHLNGGIPNRDLDGLADYWTVFPGLREALFEADRPGYSRPHVPADRVQATIRESPEFEAFAARVRETFWGWRDAHRPTLLALSVGADPTALIDALSEDLLQRFEHTELLDAYRLYQHLMDFWAETMQDDAYLVASEGWTRAARPRKAEPGETPDLTVARVRLKLDLVPAALVVARFFAADRAQVERLEAAAEAAGQAVDEFVDEHGGEDGLLDAATTDAGKVTAASVKARLREVGRGADDREERLGLQDALRLMQAETEAKKTAKDAAAALDLKTVKRFETLTEAEVQALVVDDKWLATVEAAAEAGVACISRDLSSATGSLERRYNRPMLEIVEEITALSERVSDHLQKVTTP